VRIQSRPRNRGVLRAALALAIVVGPSLPGRAVGDAAPAMATKLSEVEGVGYAAEVEPGLYRGSQPSKTGVAWLKRLGVKTVINLRRFHGAREQRQVEEAGMRFEHIPMEASDPPSRAQVARFMTLATDPSLRPVFVHCAQGVDRTGTMLAVYRMERHGYTNTDALAEMVAFGAHGVWRDLKAFVRSYSPRGAWRAQASASAH
jgi:tyrosine-protein phosphatase SIW14